jgi:hypothetical protein
LSDEQQQYPKIIEEGTNAKALLEHPAWQMVTKELRDTWADAILKSPPGDQNQREFFYYLSLCLDHIEGVLAQRQQQADQAAEILALDEMEKGEIAQKDQGE